MRKQQFALIVDPMCKTLLMEVNLFLRSHTRVNLRDRKFCQPPHLRRFRDFSMKQRDKWKQPPPPSLIRCPYIRLNDRVGLPHLLRTVTLRDLVAVIPETPYQYPRASHSLHSRKLPQSAPRGSHSCSLQQLHNRAQYKQKGLCKIARAEQLDPLAPALAQEERLVPQSLPLAGVKKVIADTLSRDKTISSE